MWRYPASEENTYLSFMREYIWFLRQGIDEILSNYTRLLSLADMERGDSFTWAGQSSGLILKFGEDLEEFVDRNAFKFEQIGVRTENFNRQQWERQVQRAVGLSPIALERWKRSLIESFVSTNTLLIKNLNQQVLSQVQTIVDSGIRRGLRVETIRKRLLAQSELQPLVHGTKTSLLRQTRRRAELIAIDQIGSFNSDLTKQRQKDLGIPTYTWRNAGDIRVRGNPGGLYPDSAFDHWEREGKVFAWEVSPGRYPEGVNPPPEDGHPGRPIRCRCWAEPNFEGVDL